MSKKRNPLETAYWGRRHELVPFAFDLPHRHKIPEHDHHRDQLIYAISGVMTVITAEGTWVVPPNRAVWVPAKVKHHLRLSGSVGMRTLYLRARMVKSLPRSCCVVAVPPLLRELIVHLVAVGPIARDTRRGRLLLDMLLDLLGNLSAMPLHVPWPNDPRARRIADWVASDPGEPNSLQGLSKRAAVGRRTVERLFIAETKLSFRDWRQQIRLLKSLELLAAGKNVTVVAMDVGYESVSAFIAAFRRAFGTTPRRYYHSAGK